MEITGFQQFICSQLPITPPEDVLQWSDRTGHMDYDAIVYRAGWQYDPLTDRKYPAVECTCSACGKTFAADRWDYGGCNGRNDFGPYICGKQVFTGSSVHCPVCGKKVTAYHCSDISKDGRHIVNKIIMSLMLIDGNPAAVTWLRSKTIDKQGRTYIAAHPYEAYVFAGKKCNKYVGWYSYFSTYVQMDHWECRLRCDDTLADFDRRMIAPWDYRMLDGTIFENAKLDLYLKESKKEATFPITYLRSFQQHPQVENLIMQGCSRLYNELIEENRNNYYYRSVAKIPMQGIYWKNKKPHALLGVTKEDFRRIKSERWTLSELHLMQEARANGVEFDLLLYRKRKKPEYYETKTCLRYGVDPFRLKPYLDKQKKKDKKIYFGFLEDYWKMCKALEIPLSTRIAFPQDLRREHDRVTDLYNAQKAEIEAKKQQQYNAAFTALHERYAAYAWENNGLTIEIASMPKDLIVEGQKLGHCVGTYISEHAKGKCCIFLLRRTEKKEEPYYTLELDMNALKVLQNRGKRNCERTPEVAAFENAWLQHIAEVTSAQSMRKGA